MRKRLSTFSIYFTGIVLLGALLSTCKKNSPEEKENPIDPGNHPNPACMLTGETTNLNGYDASWQVQYNSSKRVNKIIKFNRYNQQEYVIEVQPDRIIRTAANGDVVKTVYNANIYEALPAQAKVSISLGGGLELTDYYIYNFTYDENKRLSRIVGSTPNEPNDKEWALAITYNDKNNVSLLQYSFTTHPTETVAPITINGYDDKYSPYAGIPYWKFLMYNYGWDNSDPEPLLSALSINNPLNYTLNAGTQAELKRTMTYTYTDKGFPSERFNTNKRPIGETTFKQSFSYECQ